MPCRPLHPVIMNLDSLGRVELQAEVEQQYGVTLSDADLGTIRTREDLNTLIARGSCQGGRGDLSAQVLEISVEPGDPSWACCVYRSYSVADSALLGKAGHSRQPKVWPTPPALIICNHLTSYDAPFILFVLPPHIRRRVAIAMSGEMLVDYRRGETPAFSDCILADYGSV